ASVHINQLLKDFKPLIHKTMQRLNIHSNHMDYDDFYQELQIKLISIYKSFNGDPLNVTTDSYRFTSYASTGLYWHGLNLLRKENHVTLQLTENEQIDWLAYEEDASNSMFKSDLFIEDFLKQVKSRLTDQEYLLLLYIVEGKYTVLELAELLNVSRDTIYQRKNKIQKRLHGLKECLMN